MQLKKKFKKGDRVYLSGQDQPPRKELNVSGDPVLGTGGWQIPVKIKTWDSSSTPVRNFPGTQLITKQEWQAQQAMKRRQQYLLESTADASSRRAVAVAAESAAQQRRQQQAVEQQAAEKRRQEQQQAAERQREAARQLEAYHREDDKLRASDRRTADEQYQARREELNAQEEEFVKELEAMKDEIEQTKKQQRWRNAGLTGSRAEYSHRLRDPDFEREELDRMKALQSMRLAGNF